MTFTSACAEKPASLVIGRLPPAQPAPIYVNEVVSPEDLLGRCDEIVQRLADIPVAGIARTKAAIRREVDAGLDAELVTLGATQGALLTSEAFRNAVSKILS